MLRCMFMHRSSAPAARGARHCAFSCTSAAASSSTAALLVHAQSIPQTHFQRRGVTCSSVILATHVQALPRAVRRQRFSLMRRLSRLSGRAAALTRLARKAGSRPASGPLPAGQSRRGPIPHNTAPACGTAPRIAPPAPSAHRACHTRPSSPDAARRFCRRTGRRTACGKCTPPSLP